MGQHCPNQKLKVNHGCIFMCATEHKYMTNLLFTFTVAQFTE